MTTISYDQMIHYDWMVMNSIEEMMMVMMTKILRWWYGNMAMYMMTLVLRSWQ